MAGDVVCSENSAGNQIRNDCFVTRHVSVFIGVQKTKGHLFKILNLLPRIALDLMNEILETSDLKRFASGVLSARSRVSASSRNLIRRRIGSGMSWNMAYRVSGPAKACHDLF